MSQQPEIYLTKDGSHTLLVPHLNEHYHSTYGAIQESRHIYIQNGLAEIQTSPISILEIGFGTGLNALLTQLENKKVTYTALEPYPLTQWKLLNYPTQLHIEPTLFHQLHLCEWEKPILLTSHFTLIKHKKTLQKFQAPQTYDLIYFDAFNPKVAPDLWTLENFQKLYTWLNPSGILATYCAKGDVRRALTEAGFSVEKRQGPPGKTHITIAKKSVIL